MDSDQPEGVPSSMVVGFDRTGRANAGPDGDEAGPDGDEAGPDGDDAGGRTVELDLDRWTGLAADTLAGEGVTEGRLDLIFVGPDEMAELNQAHMGHEGPTDVLSFPLDAPNLATPDLDPANLATPDLDPANLDMPNLNMPDVNMLDLDMAELVGELDDGDDPTTLHLGDVIVCPEVAVRQAPDHCGDPDAELSLLVIHGVLHVLGHDHAEPAETEAMQARERHHLARLGYRHPEFQ